MLKIACLSIFAFLFVFPQIANAQSVSTDSLSVILRIPDQYVQEKKLVNYLRSYFNNVQLTRFNASELDAIAYLSKNNLRNVTPIRYFIESIYQARTQNWNDAENSLLNAIVMTSKNPDRYLSYTFLTHLAFIQLYKGDVIGAMSSYRMAKKEAIVLKDAYLQVLIGINISDI